MFQILKREITLLLRDRASVVILFVFPIVLVALLGTMLTSLDMAEQTIDDMTVYYTVDTADAFDLAVVEGFVQALGETEGVDMVETTDLAAARHLVETKEAAGALHFTEPLAVELYEGLDNTQNRALSTIVSGFAVEMGALRTVAEAAPERLADAMDMDASALVADREFTYSRTMLDYYAVAMLVMMVFMAGSMNGAMNIYDSRQNGTMSRVLASPKNRVSLYVQGILGSVPLCLTQIAIIMAGSVLLFGAHYADTVGQNVLLYVTFFAVALSVNGVFSLVGLFLKVNPFVVIMPIVWGVMFISGTFTKEIYIEGITNNSPIWIIQQAAFDLTVFGRGERCLLLIAVCAGLFVLSVGAGALLYRRKSNGNKSRGEREEK